MPGSIADFFGPNAAQQALELQMRLNGNAGTNYPAPASPETMQNMQRYLPPPAAPPTFQTPATPPTGRGLFGMFDTNDMGAAAGGSGLPMPPQAPAAQPQMPGFMQSGGGMLDGLHNFVLQNRGALAGLGAALQQGKPVGYGMLAGQEIDKKRKDEEDQKTADKNFADATAAFIKEPWMQAMIKADPKRASEVVKLFQEQQREANDQAYRKETLALQKAAGAREQGRYDREMAGEKYRAFDPDKIYLDANGNRLDLGQSGGATVSEKTAKLEGDIRKEFTANPAAKDFGEVDAAYRRIHALASKPDPTGASDIGVVYGLMKMYDPTSVVREGEFATAQNASGVDEKVRALYNGIISGQKLTPEQRKSFVSAADTVYQTRANTYEGTRNQYTGIAKAYGLNPDRILSPYERFTPPKAEEPKAAAGSVKEGATATNPKTGQRVIFQGGQWRPM